MSYSKLEYILLLERYSLLKERKIIGKESKISNYNNIKFLSYNKSLNKLVEISNG